MDTKKCFFSLLSYYGFISSHGPFCAAFSSNRTQCPANVFNTGDRLFEFQDMYHTRLHDFEVFVRFLQTKNFGFVDFLGYVLPLGKKPDGTVDRNMISPAFDLTPDNIFSWLLSLKVIDAEIEKTHQKLTIGSDRDPEYKLTLYAQENPGPQEATDVSVYFYKKPQDVNKNATHTDLDYLIKNNKITLMTTLGYKNRSPEVKIKFPGYELQVITIGMFRWLYGSGEHLEPDEAQQMRAILEVNKDRIAAGIPVELPATEKISSRALQEECGIDLENQRAYKFIVGVHDKEGRDPRYWSHEFEGYRFGIKRASMSVLVAVLISFKSDSDIIIDEPTDPAECSKPRLVTLQSLVPKFTVGGEYSPAFPAHVEQLKMVREALPKILVNIP